MPNMIDILCAASIFILLVMAVDAVIPDEYDMADDEEWW